MTNEAHASTCRPAVEPATPCGSSPSSATLPESTTVSFPCAKPMRAPSRGTASSGSIDCQKKWLGSTFTDTSWDTSSRRSTVDTLNAAEPGSSSRQSRISLVLTRSERRDLRPVRESSISPVRLDGVLHSGEPGAARELRTSTGHAGDRVDAERRREGDRRAKRAVVITILERVAVRIESGEPEAARFDPGEPVTRSPAVREERVEVAVRSR